VTTHGASDRTAFVGNVVIGRHSGIRFMNAQDMPTTDLWVLNNTLIDNQRNFNISLGTTFSNVTIQNNISYVDAADADHGAIHDGDLGPGSTMGSNLWSSEPAAALYDAATDLVVDPEFSKSNGWRQIDSWDSFATADFSLPSTSPAIDVGVALGADYERGLTTGTDFHAEPATVVTVAQGEVGSGWDMGAWIYREAAPGGAGGGTAGAGGQGTAGGAATGGQGGDAPAAPIGEPDSDGGCSCRTGGKTTPNGIGWCALLLGTAFRRRGWATPARAARRSGGKFASLSTLWRSLVNRSG
jgi:hypothetical protein